MLYGGEILKNSEYRKKHSIDYPRCLTIERATGQCESKSSSKNRGFQVILHGPFVSTRRFQRSSVLPRISIAKPEILSILTIQR
jgi:hypothetical protein